MSLDAGPTIDDILAFARTSLSPVPLYETNVPLDVEREIENGQFDPFAVMSLGGPVEVKSGRVLSCPRANVMQYWVVFTTVAPDDTVARMLKFKILNALTGYEPVDASALAPRGGQAQSSANENRVPNMYQHRVMFEFYQNMES